MIRSITAICVCLLIVSFSSPTPATASAPATTIPTFTIINISAGSTVTIKTQNFPANDSFDVLMGPIGTQAVNGIKVAVFTSSAGGSISDTFNIPEELQTSYQIAIRLESNSGSGYYAYNWFYNHSASGAPPKTPTGTPTSDLPGFSITEVVKDISITISTHNFPKNDQFDVLMGQMGTRGIHGIRVATVSSGNGGKMSFTFDIPTSLTGQYQIAIRLQSNTGSGYYAYNWFYNNTGSGGSWSPPSTAYSGFPIFNITNVVRDTSVTIETRNLPPNDQFKVLMGPMGTRGLNGYYVTTIDSGGGGKQTLIFNIPNPLIGSAQISIRLQSVTGSGYYAYNWFHNNTTK